MKTYEVLKDIRTLIDGTLKEQTDITNKYLKWDITEDDFEAMSDGEVLDIVYDIVKEAV
jgi:hypothetical protein